MSGAVYETREMTTVSKEKATMDFPTHKDAAKHRGLLVRLIGAAALVACLLVAPQAGATPDDFGLTATSASVSTEQAGAHPDFETRFNINGNPSQQTGSGQKAPWAGTRDIATELPPGLLANPSAFPTCSAQVFVEQLRNLDEAAAEYFGTGKLASTCPLDSQVGTISPGVADPGEILSFPPGAFRAPLYNLEAPGGNSGIVARLGFIAVFYPLFIDVRIDPKRDNALTATVVNAPSAIPLTGSFNNFWGAPTDSSHDLERFNWFEALACGGICPEKVENEETHEFEFKVVPRRSGLKKPTAFMQNPTSCGAAHITTTVISYQGTEGGDSDLASSPDFTGCESVPFEPTMSLEPTTRSAGAASGVEASLHIPQDGLKEPDAPRTADLKEATVSLPEGFSLNASAADGLGSCSPSQIGLDRNERQVVGTGPDGPGNSGNGARVSLSFGNQETPVLPELASAAEVQAALEALPNIGAGDIAVSGRLGGPWTVDFRGALSGQDVPTIGGTRSELQQLGLRVREGGGGTYRLGFGGEETGDLAYEASAAEVQAALEDLAGIGGGNVEVRPIGSPGVTSGPVFRIAFTGSLEQTNVAEITINSSLTSPFGTPIAEVSTLAEGGSPVTTDTVQQGGEIRFNGDKPSCPESSKIATGEISTPVLGEPLKASFYLAKQQDNPYNSLFAGYLVAKGAGALIKVPARIDVDPNTGQVTTTFTNNPQQPFEDLELHFKGGNRGLITTPDKCGTYASTYELTPWSGNPPVKGTSEFTLDQNCGAKPFAPGFHAGSETALAGSFTTFATEVTNEPGAPDLTRISVDLPEGLAAKLAGVGICPDSALASLPTGAGTGQAQIANPSCPASSQVGTVQAGAGSGSPFYVKTGKAYLAGPYKGAPLSLAVLTPAVAGPFDLGNVLVRVPISLDRKTARAHAVSDLLPTSLQGIPLDLRDVRVLLDRQGFALNPTSCEPKQANGVIEGTGGASANVSDRFQVGECAALGFKPKLALKLKGGTKRGDHPALTAVFRPRPGDANTSYVQVALPKSEFLDQGHIGTVCTRVQFDADQCPKASIYGSVTAQTPLLDQPLTGNVYLRSSSNELPDLVMDLRGPASQPIHLEADGRIDSIKGGIRTTFEFVPDAPITRVVLKMRGAKKGLLQNSRDICAQTFKANASFAAHNGRTLQAQPEMQARCKGSARKGKKHGKSHR